MSRLKPYNLNDWFVLKFIYLTFLSLALLYPLDSYSRVNPSNTSSTCGIDRFEPNNSRARARNLSTELKDNREISAKLCQEDRDWYTVWLNRGELVEFQVYSPLDTPPKMKIFAPRKRKPSGVLKTLSPSSRALRIYAKKSGRYRLQLLSSREAQTSYILILHRPAH